MNVTKLVNRLLWQPKDAPVYMEDETGYFEVGSVYYDEVLGMVKLRRRKEEEEDE